MDEALRERNDKKNLRELREEVKKMCKKFPIYNLE
jgi:glycine/serine hydroxymethyltransferase